MATDVKVDREGVVTRGGKTLGHVKKEMRQGIFATALGAGYSAGGTPYWVPFADDGTKLHNGYDTRKRAVARIAAHAEPLTADGFKVETGLGTSLRCVSGWVKFKGYALGVSRYAHESQWVVDFLSTPDSIMPQFSNGTGTRCTRAQVLQPDAAKAATDAAIAAGVWPIRPE